MGAWWTMAGEPCANDGASGANSKLLGRVRLFRVDGNHVEIDFVQGWNRIEAVVELAGLLKKQLGITWGPKRLPGRRTEDQKTNYHTPKRPVDRISLDFSLRPGGMREAIK